MGVSGADPGDVALDLTLKGGLSDLCCLPQVLCIARSWMERNGTKPMLQDPPQLQTEIPHPLDTFRDEWHLSRRSVYSEDLIVLHDLQPPDEVEVVATHHLLSLQLNHGSHQITRMDEREYDGSFPIGSIFLLPAYCSGSFYWETVDEAVIFILAPEFLRRIAAQTECLNPDQLQLRPILIDRDPQVEHIGRLFRDEMQTQGLGGQLYCESLANSLAIHILRNYCTDPPRLGDCGKGLSRDRLRHVLEVIHSSLDQTLRLETLAAEVNLDVYYFSRLFRQSTGISPYQYVLQQRVKKAKSLLKQHGLTITEVAMECGFNDPSHLARHFRKIVGVSPRVYRQQIQ